MEDAILQSCKDVQQSLELHFKEHKTNADFWACKAMLRAAVAAHNDKIQPMVREFNATGGDAKPATERVKEAYISLLLRIAEAALHMNDAATADGFLDALEVAGGTLQETHVRQVMQESAQQSKAQQSQPAVGVALYSPRFAGEAVHVAKYSLCYRSHSNDIHSMAL